MKKVYLHADLDAFFASVEILDHPEWKNLPVIVGGKPEDRRSVVSTASYEARKYGVHSAMPSAVARHLCPNGIFVHPRMDRYLELSEKVMSIFSRYSPDVHQISIDEAFIDLTGTEKLFGSPALTAKKIKEDVRKETGLTVSIGLASTKYAAKIASDLRKPDGFFEVAEGCEESLMLSLPLKKIWGIGEKTLALIEHNGIKTTRDLHEKPLNLLTALFGQVTGTFLYNAVRGLEKETFNTPAKSHSISAENTYPFDLTSEEAIETALLELSHAVIWRMRRENLRSFTASLKIRYENFVTVSVQETSDHEISSIDDLFERAKKLFYKKSDSSKGIRLLGLSLQNTESAASPRQTELFDFGEEKKRKVEEAVLKAESKMPGIKITKARLLTPGNLKTLIFAIFSAGFIFAGTQTALAETSSQTKRDADGAGSIVFDSTKLPPLNSSDADGALFNYSVFDRNVDFTAEGYWKSVLTGTFTSTGGGGNDTAVSVGTPVLSSEVDLNLLFMLEKKWYFEAAFAENFDRNTVAAGYRGEGVLKEARIANRGIKFPAVYSVDELNRGIGGGDNLAPGISVHLEDSSWKADFAIRYDSVETKSKTWYGKNSVSVQQIAPEDYETGFQYVLPSKQAVQSVAAVYVESSTGDYSDQNGRTYRKLDSSQYVLSAQNYSVFLSKDAKAYRTSKALPAVALQFESSYSPAAELGSYGTADSPGSGFLGETQKGFSKNLKNYSLELSGTIGGNTVYYVQYPARFSPFAACYRYDGGLLTSGDASVCSASTQAVSKKYSVTLGENDFSTVLTDFFNSSHIYADVYCEENSSALDVKYRFPFCTSEDEQGAYLGYGASSDLVVSIKTYTQVLRFEIGTNAAEGSVRVYKNGIQDSTAVYDSSTGCISLSSGFSSSDKITAQWNEDSSDFSKGALAAAAGVKKQFTKNISGDVSFSANWTIPDEDDSSTSANSSPGYTTLAAGFNYDDENFKFRNTAAVSLETTDTTGKFTVSEMDEEKAETFYLSKTSGVSVPDEIEPVINPRPDDSSSSKITLLQTKNGSKGEQTPVSDSSITGYAIPVEWDFSGISTSAATLSPYWGALSVKLPGVSGILASCSTFSISLKIDSSTATEDYSVYLQLGVDADEDLEFEDSALIPAWKISLSDSQTAADLEDVKSGLDLTKKGEWQTVTVKLTDEDKSLVSRYAGARLIITSDSAVSGKILAGPYEGEGAGFSVKSERNSTVCMAQERTVSGSTSNYAQKFDFQNTSTDTFTITRYFGEMDFENYRYMVLKTKLTSESAALDNSSQMTVTLDRPETEDTFKTAVKLTLTSDDLQKLCDSCNKGNYRELKINLLKKTANFGTVEKAESSVVPTRFKIELTTAEPVTLYLDDFSFTDCNPYAVVQDVAKLSYQKKGDIIKAGSLSLLRDFNFESSAKTAAAVKKQDTSNRENLFTGSAKASVILADFSLSGEAGRSSSSNIPFSTAAHSVKTAVPLFKFLSAEETFNFNNTDESLKKINSLKADFSSFKIPLSVKAKTSGEADAWALNQDSSAKIRIDTKYFDFSGTAGAKQKILPPNAADFSDFEYTDYAVSWQQVTDLAFNPGSAQASTRNVYAQADFQFEVPFFNAKPSYKISSAEKYKNSSYTTYTDSTVQSFVIPFSVKKHSFSFSWEKTTGGVQTTAAGGKYSNDAQFLAKTLTGRKWYFVSLPFYDIFSSSINRKVLADSSMNEDSVESLYYTTLYSASWKRSFSATWKDFFLPQSASLSFERDVKTSSSTADIWQFKGLLGFNALNVFGSKSALHLTDFFEQDEYLTSFSLALKAPKENLSACTVLLSVYQQSTFYINEDSTLKAGAEITFEDRDNLSAKGTFVFKRPGKKSFLENAARFFYKKGGTNRKSALTRTDSLNIALSRASSSVTTTKKITRHQNYEYLHSLDIQLNRYIQLNSSAGLSYDCICDKAVTLGATMKLGATVKF